MSTDLDRGSKFRIGIAIVLSIAFLAVLFFNIQLRMMPEWSKTSLHYELGKKVNIQATDVLSKNSHTFHVDTSQIDEKKPGVYIVKASFDSVAGKQVKYLRITISDTKKPVFTKAPKSVQVQVGKSDYDFAKKFKATDQTKVELSFDTKKVNFYVPGTYKAKVTATDTSGNERTKSFKVKIVWVVNEKEEKESTATQQDTTLDTPSTDNSYSNYDANTDTTNDTYSTDTDDSTTPDYYDSSQYE